MNTYPSTIEFESTLTLVPTDTGNLDVIEIIPPLQRYEGFVCTDERTLALEGVGGAARDLLVSNGRREVDIDPDRGDDWVAEREKRTGGNDDDGHNDCKDSLHL